MSSLAFERSEDPLSLGSRFRISDFFRASEFDIRISFGFRHSDLGFNHVNES